MFLRLLEIFLNISDCVYCSIDLDFYQKTGGREEIESFVNSNIDFKNIVILSNNFNYFNITDDVVFHFYDTNNISYKLPKLNGVNIIELAILKQKIFGGNFRFYNIFPALDMFDSYDHYEEVIIKNDITYIYGNNFEECINILKNKFQYDKCIPYTNSEILKNELDEYTFTENLLSNDTDVYFLFNPKLSYKNTFNSLRLISLIKDVQYCEYINIPIVLISTKDQDLQEMLKLNNIKNHFILLTNSFYLVVIMNLEKDLNMVQISILKYSLLVLIMK